MQTSRSGGSSDTEVKEFAVMPRGVAGIGIYSVGPMWEEITGGSDAFVDYPNWVAGATTINGARRTCIGAGFSGGPVLLTQYTHHGFDANHRC